FIEVMKNEGYDQGLKAGAEEVENRKRQLEEEYNLKREELDKEYQAKVADIEPKLVDTFINVFSNVTHTIAEDKKDMIIYLINSVMNNVDTCKEFVIHVSPDDYRFAINNQNLITGALSKEVHIEISEDSTLSRNECLIETDSGVFDCSLDVQLSNLVKDIKLLSCMNR
ncbi:MAG: FliH/SctL family protein, partial [Lachnospiraceae bacterium]